MKGMESCLKVCQKCSKSIPLSNRQSVSSLTRIATRSQILSSSSSSRTFISSRALSSSAAAHPIDSYPSNHPEPSSSSSFSSPSSISDPSTSTSSSRFPSPSSLNRAYGQPLPHTHPHLFPLRDQVGSPLLDPHGNTITTPELELTPGITALEYEERRKRLMKRLPEGSVVVATAGRLKCMSANIFYRFRQESNFWYLTGFQEPDALLVLESTPSISRGYKMTMFVSPRDEHNETWNGPRTGESGAKEVFGADEAFPMEPTILLNQLRSILTNYSHIYVDPSPIPSIPRATSRSTKSNSPSILNFLSAPSPSSNGLDIFKTRNDFDSIVRLLGDVRKSHSLSRELDVFRVKKSISEIGIMRRAGKASSKGMISAMGESGKKGRTEMEIQATFEYTCSMNGGQRPAYVPVVASGDRALTIHYTSNDQLLPQNENGLICLDGGCELDGYASDITRAFPCNETGTFTKPQKDLYQGILNVLHKCTKLCTEDGGFSLSDLHRKSVDFLRLELINLGFHLPNGNLERYLYPHYLGHWLGIDLHDSSTVPRSTILKDGMVLTIEPALYIPIEGPGAEGCPKEFRGIGIRIEDDVLVRKNHNVILSAEAPREVVDVEAACQRFFDKKETFEHQEKDGTDSSTV